MAFSSGEVGLEFFKLSIPLAVPLTTEQPTENPPLAMVCVTAEVSTAYHSKRKPFPATDESDWNWIVIELPEDAKEAGSAPQYVETRRE